MCLRNIGIIRTMICLLFVLTVLKSYGQLPIAHTVYFSPNSIGLNNQSRDILDQIIKKCKASRPTFIKIFAYADTLGSETFNKKLSKKRAHAVFRYLTARVKIDSSKIYVTWLGESAEGYELHFDGAHIQERCADILLYFKKD